MSHERFGRDTLVIVLGGGQGERLYPLTRDRTKPAVPFGGVYRIIDFTLSNCLNSGLRRIYVLTQYKSISLERHLRLCWNCFHEELGEFVVPVPPQQRVGERWYLGTADAIFHNIYTLEQERPSLTLILAGDHIYKMNNWEMIAFHRRVGAEITVASVKVPLRDGCRLGVMGVDDDMRIVDFKEKPDLPAALPDQSDLCCASMGIYVFNTPTLVQLVSEDAKQDTTHDFGRDILPRVVHERPVYAYLFGREGCSRGGYWRDIGTIDAYWKANMDLLDANPPFDLYDSDWPIRTYYEQYPPAKMICSDADDQAGCVRNSTISQGCLIERSQVERSVLSLAVRIEALARVEESILMDGVVVGKECRLRKTIVDKDVVIPPGTVVGWDHESDRRKFVVTADGVVVVPKDVPASGEFWQA